MSPKFPSEQAPIEYVPLLMGLSKSVAATMSYIFLTSSGAPDQIYQKSGQEGQLTVHPISV